MNSKATSAVPFSLTDSSVKSFTIGDVWVENVVLSGAGLATAGLRVAILDKNDDEVTRDENRNDNIDEKYIVRVSKPEQDASDDTKLTISVKVEKALSDTKYHFAVTIEKGIVKKGDQNTEILAKDINFSN